MIPPEKSEIVFRGLREAFGTTAIDDLRPLTAGLSSDLNFRIVVKGSPFLLRIMTQINERNEPARIFAATKAAADAALAPHVWYANTEDGILLTDFVEAIPFPPARAAQLMPATLRRCAW